MSDVGYAAALVLAGVFAWAGVAKLADRGRATTTFTSLGIAGARVLGTALPVAELVLAAGLVLVPSVASYAALAVLAAFTTFLVRALRSGVAVPCGCFGSASTQPVSSREVARNVLLAVAALVATFAAGPRVPDAAAVVVVAAATVVAAAALHLVGGRRRSPAVPG